MNQRKPAQPPGSLIYVGEEMKHTIHLQGISYSAEDYHTFDVRKVSELPSLSKDQVHWINVNGVHRVDPVRDVGQCFSVPQLILEDILNTEQRPKIDVLDGQLFIVLKMLYLHNGSIAYEHLSMVLGDHYLLTFQEQPWDVFEPVRRRVARQGGRIRNLPVDYLAYALMDAVVDHYLLVCDHVEDEIEAIEETVFRETQRETIETLHAMQRELIFLAKTFRGGREVRGRLQRCESEIISKNTHLYLQDVNDHMLQAVESVEVYREMVHG